MLEWVLRESNYRESVMIPAKFVEGPPDHYTMIEVRGPRDGVAMTSSMARVRRHAAKLRGAEENGHDILGESHSLAPEGDGGCPGVGLPHL